MSAAVIFPKYRGDLVACAAITRAMYQGKVESVHYPRNPLDVLAQQIVAMVAMDEWDVGELLRAGAPRGALRGADAQRVRQRAGHAERAGIRRTSSRNCGRA